MTNNAMRLKPVRSIIVAIYLIATLCAYAVDPLADQTSHDLTARVSSINSDGVVLEVIQVRLGGGAISYENDIRRILVLDLADVAEGEKVTLHITKTGEIKQGLRCYRINPNNSGGAGKGVSEIRAHLPSNADAYNQRDDTREKEAYRIASRYIKITVSNALTGIDIARTHKTIPDGVIHLLKNEKGRIVLVEWFRNDLEIIQTRTEDIELKQSITNLLQINKE